MKSEPLPEYLMPHRLARQGARFAGTLPLASLRRFSEEVLDSGGEIDVALELFQDDENRTCISGTVATRASMICQRCLEPVELSVQCDVSLAVVGSDEAAANLPPEYDPLLLDGERIELVAVIEDDLLLGLPVTPRHVDGACEAPGFKNEQARGTGDQDPSAKENPFSQLRALRKDS